MTQIEMICVAAARVTGAGSCRGADGCLPRLREIGKADRHDIGEAGVTRVLWRAGDPAELDSAEELPTRQQVPYQWHRDAEFDGITMRDPDGLGFVLLWVGEKVPANGAPAWLYWCY